MCRRGNQTVVADLRAVLRLEEEEELPTTSQQLARLADTVLPWQ